MPIIDTKSVIFGHVSNDGKTKSVIQVFESRGRELYNVVLDTSIGEAIVRKQAITLTHDEAVLIAEKVKELHALYQKDRELSAIRHAARENS